jgi:hypothetical protein
VIVVPEFTSKGRCLDEVKVGCFKGWCLEGRGKVWCFDGMRKFDILRGGASRGGCTETLVCTEGMVQGVVTKEMVW